MKRSQKFQNFASKVLSEKMLKVKKILVVDDDRGISEALKYALEATNYKVETEDSGDGISQKVKDFLPDLILLDFLLPGKDGGKIAQYLKKEKATRHIPILVISAHLSVGEISKDCGADEFIAKPFNMNQLLGKIEKYLRA